MASTRRGELELAGEPVEKDEAVALRLVADVVGQPGEAVHGEQMVPDRTRQEPRGHRKFSAPACPSTVSVPGNESGVNIGMRSGASNCSFIECK